MTSPVTVDAVFGGAELPAGPIAHVPRHEGRNDLIVISLDPTRSLRPVLAHEMDQVVALDELTHKPSSRIPALGCEEEAGAVTESRGHFRDRRKSNACRVTGDLVVNEKAERVLREPSRNDRGNALTQLLSL